MLGCESERLGALCLAWVVVGFPLLVGGGPGVRVSVLCAVSPLGVWVLCVGVLPAALSVDSPLSLLSATLGYERVAGL